MPKLKAPSIAKSFASTLLEMKDHWVFNGKSIQRQYDQTVLSVGRGYKSATARERHAIGVSSLDELIGQLMHPYSTGDIDLLAAYEKFSVFKNPSLPIAVANFRLAVGKRRVTSIITQKHLDLSDRVVHIFHDIVSEGEGQQRASVLDRKFERLSIFVFTNMDHADDILRIVEDRKLIDPKDITAILDNDEIISPLAEGIL